MKNYKELSAVVLFAILVHSALTASLVNIFITLHGVGGGVDVDDEHQRWGDAQLYFSDALNHLPNNDVSPSNVDGRGERHSSLQYNFQPQEQSISKKKIISDNMSLETYSAMLSKQRQGSDDESIESMRLRAKQSKYRYMR